MSFPSVSTMNLTPLYRRFRDVLNNISKAILQLPKPIRRVCAVQIFAFIGWFPFLFYA